RGVWARESGLAARALRVARAVGRAVGLTVEELFGPGGPVPPVSARPVAPLGNGGARVTLAPIGDDFVALPLSGASVTRAGFLPAGGLAFGADGPGASSAPDGPGPSSHQPPPPAQASPAVPVRPIEPPRPPLGVAGWEPATP